VAPIIADPIFDPMYGQISRGVNLFPQRPPQQARAPRAPPTRGCIPNIARHSTMSSKKFRHLFCPQHPAAHGVDV